MVLEKLELQNFRSYKKALFEFSPETTLIVGPNTSGKTNILEAIFLLALGRTFRPGLEREIIRFGEEVGRVKGKIGSRKWEVNPEPEQSTVQGKKGERGKGKGGEELEVVLTRGEVLGKPAPLKRLLVNGVSRRLYNFVGNLQVVMFGPQDLQLVTDSPTLRRGHLDFVLEQVDEEYRRKSVIYGKALSQRNRLLKLIGEGKRGKRELEYWDGLLVENGSYVTEKRKGFFEFVNRRPKELGEFEFVYQPSVLSICSFARDRTASSRSHLTNWTVDHSQTINALFDKKLRENCRKEIAAGMTLIGPHRDDFRILIYPNGNTANKTELGRDLAVYGSRGQPRKSLDLSIFGSRGEQRTAVLALKLAELEFMAHQSLIINHQSLVSRPILLLDDIFSELDEENRKHVLEVIPKQQTIITTTDLGLVDKEFLDRMKIHKLTHLPAVG